VVLGPVLGAAVGWGLRGRGASPRAVPPAVVAGTAVLVHRIVAANPPADYLWGADVYWGISRKIGGVTVSSLGLFHFLPGPLGWRPVTD